MDRDNKPIVEFKAGEIGGLTSELEILPGDLVEILYQTTKDKVRYIFGDCVTGIEDAVEKVNITFESGKAESFDLLVRADGIGSQIREMVFRDQAVWII